MSWCNRYHPAVIGVYFAVSGSGRGSGLLVGIICKIFLYVLWHLREPSVVQKSQYFRLIFLLTSLKLFKKFILWCCGFIPILFYSILLKCKALTHSECNRRSPPGLLFSGRWLEVLCIFLGIGFFYYLLLSFLQVAPFFFFFLIETTAFYTQQLQEGGLFSLCFIHISLLLFPNPVFFSIDIMLLSTPTEFSLRSYCYMVGTLKLENQSQSSMP